MQETLGWRILGAAAIVGSTVGSVAGPSLLIVFRLRLLLSPSH
jgi:hypothetical protein